MNTTNGEVTTGEVTTTRIEPTNKIIKVGTKPTVTEEVIAFETTYENDSTLPQGTEVETVAGVNGKKVTTTTYTLDEVTGVVTANTPNVEITNATNRVVKRSNVLEKPILLITNATKNDEEKTITVTHTLTDRDNTTTSLKTQIFNGDTLVQEIDFDKNNLTKTFTGLDYDIEYTIKSILNYNVNAGAQTEIVEHNEKLMLEIKKIEIKHIDNISLIKFENGEAKTHNSLAGKPLDTMNYFARIKSDKYRDILLPVKTIEETTVEGAPAYKVTVSTQELVQDIDLSKVSDYKGNMSFYVNKKVEEGNGIYTSFKSLLEAIKANPSGTFTLGSDLYAEEVPTTSARAYIDTTFTGTLTGNNNGAKYAIYNMNMPLFNTIQNSAIKELDLKNVDINTKYQESGILASRILNSKVEDVSIQGDIRGVRSHAGLSYYVENSVINNVSYEGNITTTSTAQSYTGGLVGFLKNSAVENAKVDVNITDQGNADNHRVGAVIGYIEGTRNGINGTPNLKNVYAKGTVKSVVGTSQNVGGVYGTVAGYDRAGIENVVSEVTVLNGDQISDKQIYGQENNTAKLTNVYVQNANYENAQTGASTITEEDAKTRVENMNISATTADSSAVANVNKLSTNYTTLNNAEVSRKLAYNNIEKLIPFYNKEIIVKYGNEVDINSNLYNKELLSVTPMKDKEIVSDIYSNKQSLNKLMLHYKDGTIEYLNVTYKEDFKNNAISEYVIEDTKLIYTPEQFISSYDNIINNVLTDLQSVEYKSKAVAEKLKAYTDEEVNKLVATGKTTDEAIATLVSTKMDQLYLEQEFDKVKENLASQLRKILATDKSINTTGGVVDDYIIDYIKDNKEKLLLGLAYMNRWYNIDFDEVNIKEIASYNQDFFGKPVNTLEWLVSLADKGYANIQLSNNLSTYTNSIASNTGQVDLFAYLDKNRTLFTDKDANSWFKDATKAYIVESPSKEVPDYDVSIYNRLTKTRTEQNGVLPLLTADEGIFIISTISTLTYGMYNRYIHDMSIKDTNPELYANKIAEVKSMVDKAAIWQRDHFDAWYRILPTEELKNRLFTTVPNWDGYIVNRTWLPMYGEGANQAILDFFGPIERGRIANNGSGAYTDGKSTFFVWDRVLDQYGSSVFTHEMVHNFDNSIYLGGYGRREGVGAENYALGLLQAVDANYSTTYLSLNLMFDFSEHANKKDIYHNTNPDRFQNSNDLHEYNHGRFDVLYTLDYAEANSVLKHTDDIKKKWYNKIENYYVQDAKSGENTHAGNSYRPLTDEEVARLKTWENLIEESIMTRREYGESSTLVRNGYYRASMFSPIYSALHNPNGSPGDLMFRRMAYELLAAKGYEEGFLPYTSNQYAKDAFDNGSKTYSDWFKRDVALITDDLVFEKIFNNEYSSWVDFKKRYV